MAKFSVQSLGVGQSSIGIHREVSLFLEISEFPYNTVYMTGPMKAPCQTKIISDTVVFAVKMVIVNTYTRYNFNRQTATLYCERDYS